MLSMNVELWPFGDKDSAKRLVTITLANMGRSYDGNGYDYLWTIDEPKPLFGDPISAQGCLKNYDRKASCIAIIAAILDDYRKPKYTSFSNSDNEIFERLRNKTKEQKLENRFPY